MNDIRSYNVGVSDYSKHRKQPWDWWELLSDAWRCDVVKRILRTKESDSRLLDYQKIKHILLKIKDLQDSGYTFCYSMESAKYFELLEYIENEIREDYPTLTEHDIDVFKLMFEEPNSGWPIESALRIIENSINKFSKI